MSGNRYTYAIKVREDAPQDKEPHWEVRKYDNGIEIKRFRIVFFEKNARGDQEKKPGAILSSSSGVTFNIGILNSDNTFSYFYWGSGKIKIYNLTSKGKKKITCKVGVGEPHVFDGLNLVIKGESHNYSLKVGFIRTGANVIEDNKAGTSKGPISRDIVLESPDNDLQVSEQKPVLSAPQLPKYESIDLPQTDWYNDTILGRLSNSVRNHRFRSLLGLAFTAFFLALLLTPAILPTFFAPAILGMQNVFVPYLMAKGLSLGVIASVGSFLTFTAPKWLGNVCQFVGARIFGGLFERLLLAPFLPILWWAKRKIAEGSSFDPLLAVLQILLLIPTGLSHFIGRLLNSGGNVIAGEETAMSNAFDKNDPSSPSAYKGSSSVIKRLIHATQTDVAKEYPSLKFAALDPAILFPEKRHQLSHKYAEALRFFDKNSPVPSLEQFNNSKYMVFGMS